jgi:hypothetical protein
MASDARLLTASLKGDHEAFAGIVGICRYT